MKTALVNLEMFFIPEEQHYDILMREIGNADTVIGLALADGFLHTNYSELIEKISQNVELYIMPGMSCDSTYNKVIPFNYNLHMTYNSYKDAKLNQWNSSSGKFLFLGGVPDRPNRAGLLNKLSKANLLDTAMWSFFKPWTTEQELWCKEYLGDDYEHVLTLCRKIDDAYEQSKEYGTSPYTASVEWTKDPAWIDPSIFNSTKFSIISEGVGAGDTKFNYLTEKTYRAFIQQHPFIFASNPAMFDYMKTLGFKTFEQYMAIPDYAHIEDENTRLDAIVENAKYFLNNNIDVSADVEYNYNKFFELAERNMLILEELHSKFNVPYSTIDKWFGQKGFAHLVRAYGN